MVKINVHVTHPKAKRIPLKVLGMLFHDALQITHIEVIHFIQPDCFQIIFRTFREFWKFVEERIWVGKIITDEKSDPLFMEFSFENLPESIQDEAIFNHFHEKIRHMGILMDFDASTGIFSVELPNIEFLFVLLMEILPPTKLFI